MLEPAFSRNAFHPRSQNWNSSFEDFINTQSLNVITDKANYGLYRWWWNKHTSEGRGPSK